MFLNLAELIAAYSNEKATNSLLEYKYIVDEVRRWLEEKEGEDSVFENTVLKELVEIEQNRIKYYVNEYLALRFDKIRKNFFVDQKCLSMEEIEVRRKYFEILSTRNITKEHKQEDIEFVGCYFNKKAQNFYIDGEVQEINSGEFIVTKLEGVRDYLDKNDVELW